MLMVVLLGQWYFRWLYVFQLPRIAKKFYHDCVQFMYLARSFFLKKENPPKQNKNRKNPHPSGHDCGHSTAETSDILIFARDWLWLKKKLTCRFWKCFPVWTRLSILNSFFDRSPWSGSIMNLVMPYFLGVWHSYLYLLFSPCWWQQRLLPSQCFWVSWGCYLVNTCITGQRDKSPERHQRYSVIYFVSVERHRLPFRKPITPQEENGIILRAFSALVKNVTAIP